VSTESDLAALWLLVGRLGDSIKRSHHEQLCRERQDDPQVMLVCTCDVCASSFKRQVETEAYEHPLRRTPEPANWLATGEAYLALERQVRELTRREQHLLNELSKARSRALVAERRAAERVEERKLAAKRLKLRAARERRLRKVVHKNPLSR